MRLVRVFACALGALPLLASAAQAVLSTGAYGNTARFDRLKAAEPGGVQAVHRALDPVTTAA
jgi:hypothetical protein